MRRREFLGSGIAFGSAAAPGIAFPPRLALAQSQTGVIRVLAKGPPNTFDPTGTGSATCAAGWVCGARQ